MQDPQRAVSWSDRILYPIVRRFPAFVTADRLTIARIVIAPFFWIALTRHLDEQPRTTTSAAVALTFFAIATVSDLFDGAIARARTGPTDIGGFLDPLADKLIIVPALVIATTWHPAIRFPNVLLLTTLECILVGLSVYQLTHGLKGKANMFGKAKVWCETTAVLAVTGGVLSPIADDVANHTITIATILASGSILGRLVDAIRRRLAGP